MHHECVSAHEKHLCLVSSCFTSWCAGQLPGLLFDWQLYSLMMTAAQQEAESLSGLMTSRCLKLRKRVPDLLPVCYFDRFLLSMACPSRGLLKSWSFTVELQLRLSLLLVNLMTIFSINLIYKRFLKKCHHNSPGWHNYDQLFVQIPDQKLKNRDSFFCNSLRNPQRLSPLPVSVFSYWATGC